MDRTPTYYLTPDGEYAKLRCMVCNGPAKFRCCPGDPAMVVFEISCGTCKQKHKFKGDDEWWIGLLPNDSR